MSPEKNVRAVIKRYGGPDVLALVEEPIPLPRRNELRLKVHTIGVAFADIYMRRGAYPGGPRPPFTPGFDVVGVVDALGLDVHGIEIGTRVGALLERGGSARYVCVRASDVFPIPEAVSDEAAVAALLNYVSALQLLVRVGRGRSGQAVFVHALAGGLGSAVLALAPVLGLRVVGTASAGKHAFVRVRGGEPIDYRDCDFVRAGLGLEPEGFAVVLDGIGGATLSRSHQLVARGGTLVSFGFQSAARAGRFASWPTWARAIWLALLPGRRTRLYAIMPCNRWRRTQLRADVAQIMRLLAAGELAPALTEVLPLNQIARAHALLEAGEVMGKLVLRADGTETGSDRTAATSLQPA